MRITNFPAITAGLAIIALAGCSAATQRTTTVESGGDVAGSADAAVTPADNSSIPAGATLTATLDKALGTDISRAGDTFTATVSTNLVAQNGSIVVPAGSKIEGRVTAIDDSDNAAEPALIRLAFDRIRIGGTSYPFAANIVQASPVRTTSESSSDRTRNIVIGGAVGAALGALISGNEVDKIVIGGAIGAAAGSIISLGTEVNATLPAGSMMTVRSTQTVALR